LTLAPLWGNIEGRGSVYSGARERRTSTRKPAAISSLTRWVARSQSGTCA